MTKQSRIIHCSYCLEEGHRINHCIDPSILFIHEHLSEIAAIDWKTDMNSYYLTYELNEPIEPEIIRLGYKHNIPNVTKLPHEQLISKLADVYQENNNTHEYLIKDMNLDEIDYFSNKLHEYILKTEDIDYISLSNIRNTLHANPPTNIVTHFAPKALVTYPALQFKTI